MAALIYSMKAGKSYLVKELFGFVRRRTRIAFCTRAEEDQEFGGNRTRRFVMVLGDIPNARSRNIQPVSSALFPRICERFKQRCPFAPRREIQQAVRDWPARAHAALRPRRSPVRRPVFQAAGARIQQGCPHPQDRTRYHRRAGTQWLWPWGRLQQQESQRAPWCRPAGQSSVSERRRYC